MLPGDTLLHSRGSFAALAVLLAACGSTPPDLVTLTVVKNGSGVVKANGGGLDCGTVCALSTPAGTPVTLSAQPDSGFTFNAWDGGCSGSVPSCTLTLQADTTVTATFGPAVPSSYVVSGIARGGPAATSATATSSTAGAICSGNNCRVEAGGSVVLTAPEVTNYLFDGWTGDPGCASPGRVLTVSSVTADTVCIATYRITFLMQTLVVGGTAGASITPTSTTPGAICTAGSCRVPSGGSVSAAAPSLLDWFFDGWTGAVVSANSSIAIANVTADVTVTASYANQRLAPCRDLPPANATTSSTPPVPVTYTTSGGWSIPSLCPWACNPDHCRTIASTGCVVEFNDQLAFLGGAVSKWFGGDDRPGLNRSVGTGQGVTPASSITMQRFGFNLGGGFAYSTTGLFGTQPNAIRLDRRDSAGTILATYTTTVPANWPGGWLFWTTPATALNANTLQIFTAFLTTAFTQKVTSSSPGDASAGYAGGGGYTADVGPAGDLTAWSSWATHTWDFQFRIQSRDSQCQ
jgi:hypothetical protein